MTATDVSRTMFDYCEVASPADRSWLRRAATEFRFRLRCTVAELIEAGKVLLDARKRVRRGTWRRWVEAELGLARRTTNRLVAVASVFGRVVKDVLVRFTPTALYALAQPGVPQPIREYMVERAGDKRPGEKVTAGEVMETLSCYREKTEELSRAGVKSLGLPADPKRHVDSEDVFAADNWLLFTRMVASNATLYITSTTDEENGGVMVSVSMIGADGKRRVATADRPEKALMQLSGTTREKLCSKCGETKRLDEFSELRTSADGRNRRCLACERERVKASEARSRGGDGEGMRPHAYAG